MHFVRSTSQFVLAMGLVWAGASGCSPSALRTQADERAQDIISHHQDRALGRQEPFSIETPANTLRRRLLDAQQLRVVGPASYGTDRLRPIEHWPEAGEPKRSETAHVTVPDVDASKTVHLSLTDALAVAARNNRQYQTEKESVYRAALALDLADDEFRNTYTGLLEELLSSDQSSGSSVTGSVTSASAEVSRKFESGATLTGKLAIDVAKLLSSDGATSFGIVADATVTVPLLRGAGRHIVTEARTQAQRDLIYALWSFERFKRTFAVDVADEYLKVLQNLDRVENAANNYKSQITSARRARRLADAGRQSKIELDQANQAELSARNNWISAQNAYRESLDRFKLRLGLPADAGIQLAREELLRLVTRAREAGLGDGESVENKDGQVQSAAAEIVLRPVGRVGAGPYELEEPEAVHLAFENRLDMRRNLGRVYDAQRDVAVKADALQAGLALVGSASTGASRGIATATSSSAQLNPSRGDYSVVATLDLPWERTAERNAYRESYIGLEKATRDVQELEDQIKLDVRNGLRGLMLARESYKIQSLAVQLAQRRVSSSKLFLQAGRSQIRDLLEAEADLLQAQNALTASLINYRVAELRLQRDLGLLEVDETGLWHEYDPQAGMK